MTLFPDQGILAGTGPADDPGETFFCTFIVTDSATPTPMSTSFLLRLIVGAPAPLALLVVTNQTFSIGTYRTVTLPVASGGTQPYTYSFTCAGGTLPSGMGFAPTTRVFAGTPDATFRDSCTYTVTDSAQAPQTVSNPVEVEVTGGVISLPSPSDISLPVGSFHSAVLPAASGGIQPYTYSFTCAGGALPSGMGFGPETRVFAGTPDATFLDSCTYTVTDSAQPPQTVSNPVEVAVTSTVISLPLPSDISLPVGSFHSEVLPAASGGIQPYTYSFTCAGGRLPSGMGFAPETRLFAGTPDATFRDSCTYTVTDNSQPPKTVSNPVEVAVTSTVISLPPPQDISLPVGSFHSAVLPAASGGIQPYTYSFTCAGGTLPSGMGFAPETRLFAGTPDATFRDSCTYTVTDSAQPPKTVSNPVEVQVTSAVISLPPPSDMTLPVGSFHSAVLPAASGGIQPYTYSFTCAGGRLPSGMGFAPETRLFAGTPDATFRDSCTYTVTDNSQPPKTVSNPVEVQVTSDVISLPLPSDMTLPVGSFHREVLPAASGGIQPYTYSFTCAGGTLPSGMGFAPETRLFAGTPDATFRDSCTYTVTDSAQPPKTVSNPVEVQVTSAVISLPLPSDMSLPVGSFHSAVLPAASGGIQPYTYSFTCAGGTLPSGMGFAPETRLFAGTPDATFRDSCTYTVTDNSQPPKTVSNSVEVAVTSTVISLPPPSDMSLPVGSFHSEVLPAASGGIQPYTYSFTCAGGRLPSGMGFAPETRVFAGTPDATFLDSCTYTVTDSAQPPKTVSNAVEVEVTDDVMPISFPPPQDISLSVGSFHSSVLPPASRGVQPYTYSFTCAGGLLPSGMGFASETRVFAGTPDGTFRDSCAYTVTDNSQPPETVSHTVEVAVTGGVMLPADVVPGDPANSVSFTVGRYARVEFAEASGGVPPYTYELRVCDPPGLTFSPATRTLSGTPSEAYRGPDCTYRVTDSASPPASVSRGVELTVDPLDMGTWRFRTRSLAPSDHPVNRNTGFQKVVTLPLALDGMGTETYALVNIRLPLKFDPDTRVLSFNYGDTQTGLTAPLFNTPTTFRYEVSGDSNVHDALCVDVSYKDKHLLDDLLDTVSVEIREDAYWNGTGYECPDARPPLSSISRTTLSNPVHSALAPVHARHAVNVAHAVVRDRVRGWSPGAPRKLFAFSPSVGFTSLSGLSDGFDYTGSSESLSAGAELGAGSWQAGLVASFTRTNLRYRAAPDLSGLGYHAGEHDTEVLSVHPFAAWHSPSGGHLWASLGAGLGDLRHRDDQGFPSWSRSDVRLHAYAVGASVPVADVLSGVLDTEAGIESFAFEIEGGDRISTSLPTLRGRDYRAGLRWSAPVPGTPVVSLAYKHLTGDGPEGAQVEARGSMSVAGILHPRLTLTGGAEASFGLGDYEQDSWGLGGGVRFAPGGSGRGFGLVLDSRLMSLADGRPAGFAVRGEASYGMWGGPSIGTVRPYIGLIRYPVDASLRRAVGLHLRDTPTSKVTVEVYDHRRDLFRVLGLTLTLRHHF